MTSLQESIGSLTLPVALGPVSETRTLKSLDPARRIMADLFKAAIEAEYTEAWQQATLGMSEASKISSATPVADVLELEPNGAAMQERQAKFPLLAVYRSGRATRETDTFYADKLRQPWTVDWVLGTADVATAYRFGDMAVAISKLIGRCCFLQAHPAYASGAIQFGPEQGNLSTLQWLGHEGPGQARFAGTADGPVYFAITILLESTETVDVTAGAEPDGIFEGADYEIGVGGAPEGVMPGLVYANTDPVYQTP